MTISSSVPSRRARCLVGAACAACVAGVPVGLAAQSDAVPLELARTLAGPPSIASPFAGAPNQPPAPPTITVAAPPPAFPRALVPPAPATILGGIQTGPADARLVGVVPAGQERMVAAFTQSLAARGWQAPPSAAGARGFVSASPGDGGAPVTYCHGDTVVVVRDAPRPEGGRYLLVSTSVPLRFGICSQRPAAFGPGRPFGDAPIPTLVAPVGTQTTGGGGYGGGDDEWRTSTRLATGLAPTALVAHYAPQLVAQGWTLGGRATGDAIVAQTAERRMPNGDVWRAMLVVERLPGAARSDVSLRLLRITTP